MSSHKKYPNDKHPMIWAAAMNLNGCWGPCKMKYDEECDEYFDIKENFDFSVKGCGTNAKDGIVTYGNTSQEAVQLWLNGVKTTMEFIKNRLVYHGGD
jgi:hypothetical protein